MYPLAMREGMHKFMVTHTTFMHEPDRYLFAGMNQLVHKAHGSGPRPHHQVVAAKWRHRDSL